MSAACTSCGHPIPAGQFRCGKCGAVQERDPAGVLEGTAPQRSRPPDRTPPEGSQPVVDPALSQASSREQADEEPRGVVVPRGTFASEGPPKPTEAKELEPGAQRAEGADKPDVRVSATESGPTRSSKASQSSSQRVRVARSPERPPYLASEILREDIAPREPGRDVLAAVIGASAIVGLIGVLVAGLHTAAAIALALLFVATFSIGRLRLAYATRAGALAILTGSALLAVTWWRQLGGSSKTDLLLAFGTVALASSLYVRSWYRGSIAARALVGVSLVPTWIWAFLTSHRELLSLEFIWQSWLPALTWYVFVILCLLALLAFMGEETTGGCTAWALGLCAWYAGYAGVRFALEVDVSGPMRTLGLAEPALAAPLAVSLAQLTAQAVFRQSRREAPALTS